MTKLDLQVLTIALGVSVRAQAVGQEVEDLVPGLQRGMSVLVDEVGGDNAVGGPDHFAEERWRAGVRRTARQDAAVEGVAEERLVGGEALAGAPAVVVEAVSENLQSIARDAVSDRARVLVADLESGGVVQRQLRVVDHWRGDGWLKRHGECEVAGEAQTDRADSGTAAFGVGLAREPA